MKTDFRMVIVLGAAMCGLSAQLVCHAQSPASASNKATVPPRVISTPKAEAATTLLASLAAELPGDPPAAAAAAPPVATAPPNPPASITAPLTNDAGIKDLAEMKARIAKLEAELK